MGGHAMLFNNSSHLRGGKFYSGYGMFFMVKFPPNFPCCLDDTNPRLTIGEKGGGKQMSGSVVRTPAGVRIELNMDAPFP